MSQDDVLSRLDANGGGLAKEAAAEIRRLQIAVTELTFSMIAALAKLDAPDVGEIAEMLEAKGLLQKAPAQNP